MSWRTTKFKTIQGTDGYYRVLMTQDGKTYVSTKKHSVKRGASYETKELKRHSMSWVINPKVGFEPYDPIAAITKGV